MKASLIQANRSYVNKSGRTERRVLDMETHLPIRWLGDESTEPKGEVVVKFIDTRMGKTFYGANSGKTPTTMYLSAFASWAAAEVPEDRAAPVA